MSVPGVSVQRGSLSGGRGEGSLCSEGRWVSVQRGVSLQKGASLQRRPVDRQTPVKTLASLDSKIEYRPFSCIMGRLWTIRSSAASFNNSGIGLHKFALQVLATKHWRQREQKLVGIYCYQERIQHFFKRAQNFCERGRAESYKRSEPFVAGVQILVQVLVKHQKLIKTVYLYLSIWDIYISICDGINFVVNSFAKVTPFFNINDKKQLDLNIKENKCI